MFYYNQFRIYIILPLSERLGKANYSHSVDFVKNETECFILIFNTLTRFSIYLITLVVSKSGVKLY